MLPPSSRRRNVNASAGEEQFATFSACSVTQCGRNLCYRSRNVEDGCDTESDKARKEIIFIAFQFHSLLFRRTLYSIRR